MMNKNTCIFSVDPMPGSLLVNLGDVATVIITFSLTWAILIIIFTVIINDSN